MIFKFQQGGVPIPPLVSYQPVTVTNTSGTAPAVSSEDKSSNSDLTDKDLLEMLQKLDGLPSDMNTITNTLQNFYIDQAYGILPNTSSIASKYIQILNQMKIANFNKKEYDEAFNTVNSNGGYNEVAINDRGQIFCIDKETGSYNLLSIEELKNNSNYIPLTNSDLLDYRAYNPQLAYNNDILKVVKSGIGISAVTKMIQDSIADLGETTESNQSYAKVKSKQLISGLQNFLNAQQQSGEYDATVDDLYKGTYLSKDQALQAYEALTYIYTTLPENAKTLLKTKTNNGTDEEAIQLVSTLVNSTLNYTKQFSLDLDKSSKDSKSEDSNESKDLSMAENVQQDLGSSIKIPVVPGTSDIMITDAYMYPVTTKSGQSLGITSLYDFSKNSSITGLFDFSQVSFGDQLVEMGGLQNIVADGTSIYTAYLPIDQEKASNGIITPNLNQLAQLELARNKVKETGATSPEEINKIYEEYHLPPLLINEDTFTKYYRQFGIMNGVALNDAFSDPNSARVGSPMMEEITNENDINNYWSLMKGANSKEKFNSKGVLDSFSEFIGGSGSYQQMFKGLIFLPLRTTDRNYGKMVGGIKLSEEEAIQNQIDYQQEQRIKTYKPQGQLQQ